MIKYGFILITLLVLLPSCSKKRSIHIVAKNAATGEAYSGLEYVILSSRTTADGEDFRTEASGTLTASGEAIEEVKVKGSRTYKVRVTAPPNNCYNKQVEQYFESQYDQDGTFTFEFAPCAYLKLQINNVNCQGVDDQFTLFHTGSDVGFLSELANQPIKTGSGCFTYSQTEFSMIPMGKRFYKWIVVKNNITTEFYDTINLLPDEYRIYNIDY